MAWARLASNCCLLTSDVSFSMKGLDRVSVVLRCGELVVLDISQFLFQRVDQLAARQRGYLAPLAGLLRGARRGSVDTGAGPACRCRAR